MLVSYSASLLRDKIITQFQSHKCSQFYSVRRAKFQRLRIIALGAVSRSAHEQVCLMHDVGELSCRRCAPPMLIMPRRGLLAAAVGLLAAGRVPRSSPAATNDGAFPADFVWGASTSSYQIEGAVGGDGTGKSIWDVFSHTPGRVKNGDTGDIVCDHYHRWRDDIDLLARGNFSAYRFSTAWPRILPSGSGAVEPRGLDFYERLVDGLIANG